MPSIPQSLLWMSLVVLWLFVLVPMLVSKRDAVRRTSDVALATRVLTSGSSARLLKRGGPAAGHRSDPDWQQNNADDDLDESDEAAASEESSGSSDSSGSRVFVAAAVGEQCELDYLDVDVVADEEDSDVLPLSEAGFAQARAQATAEAEAARAAEAALIAEAEAEAAAEAARIAEAEAEEAAAEAAAAEAARIAEAEAEAEAAAEAEADVEAEGYEYETIDDSSGLEAAAESPNEGRAARRPRSDSNTAAVVSARKFEFRKRVLLSLASILIVSALAAFTVAPTAWWICGGAAGATVLYLAYLRRQTRIEQQVRARRARRAERPRAQREANTEAFEVSPSRLRRPGVAVLEIDDEDPVFEHLEYASTAGEYDWRGDLPRASGQ